MNIVDIVRGTPYWAWVIFIYFIITGIKASRTRIIPLWQMSIMPLLFITWSLISLHNKCTECSDLISFLIIALLVGIVIGNHIAQQNEYSIDTTKKLITLLGSYIPLTLSLIFFVTKYILDATYAINPVMKTSLFLLTFDVTLSGIISSISLGRFIHILRIHRRALLPQKTS